MSSSAAVAEGVLRSMEEAVSVVDLGDHRITFWSPSAERLFGWKASEVLGQVLYEVAASDGWTRKRLEELVARVRAEGLLVVAGPRHRKDGAPLWIESTFCLARDETGHDKGLLIVTRDITARKAAEERLVASEKALSEREALQRATFESLGEGVIVLGADGVAIAANAAAERILGLTRAQLRREEPLPTTWRTIRDDGSPFPHAEYPAGIAQQTGTAVSEVLMGIVRPDTTRWIVIAATPLPRSDASPPVVVATFRDVTELRHEQARLRDRMRELEDALAQVRTLRGLLPICMFCHKIRNSSESWDALETFIAARTDAKFSHSICPSCETVHFPEDGKEP